jgi:hypothetical protein
MRSQGAARLQAAGGDGGGRGRQRRARPFVSHAGHGVQMATTAAAAGCAGAEEQQEVVREGQSRGSTGRVEAGCARLLCGAHAAAACVQRGEQKGAAKRKGARGLGLHEVEGARLQEGRGEVWPCDL